MATASEFLEALVGKKKFADRVGAIDPKKVLSSRELFDTSRAYKPVTGQGVLASAFQSHPAGFLSTPGEEKTPGIEGMFSPAYAYQMAIRGLGAASS